MALELSYLLILQGVITMVIASYENSYIQYAGTGAPAYSSIPAYVASYPAPSTYLSAYQTSYSTPTPGYTPPAYSPPAYSPSGYSSPSYSYEPTKPTTYQPTHQSAYQPIVPTAYPQPPSSPVYQSSTPSFPVYQPTPISSTYQQPTPVSPTYQQPTPLPPIKPELPQVEPTYTPKEIPKPLPSPKLDSPSLPTPFDSNVLNNLAIALQLLIVSNLLHNPPSESSPITEILNDDMLPAIAPLPIPFVPPANNYPPTSDARGYYEVPSANFLGTSSFGDAGLPKTMLGGYGAPTLPNPRTNAGFMSPYDSIAKSLYSDPLAASYASIKDFKSPYSFLTDATIAELFLK